MKKKSTTKEIQLNYDLTIDEETKKIITSAEGGRYSYFDYSKKIIKEIVSKDVKEIKWHDVAIIVQALFSKYLICSGIIDCFLMFEIKNNKRSDPPKYCYRNVASYLNNDDKAKVNYLGEEIKKLLAINEIECHPSWEECLCNNSQED